MCPAAEHHAVLHAVERAGGTVVPVDSAGRVRLDALAAALGPDVAVVSAMAVNNEVGSITDLAAVAAVVRQHAPSAVLHTDAVQAASWLDLRELWPHVDLLSLSAHKFGGPKGVGVLAVRDGTTLEPLIVGGGQERERRSGTHNVAGIVALAEALVATDAERTAESARIAALRDRLVAGITTAVPGARETVAPSAKVAGSAHLLFDDVESEALLYLLDREGLCASAASACASGAMEPVARARRDGRRAALGDGRAATQPRPHDHHRRHRRRRRHHHRRGDDGPRAHRGAPGRCRRGRRRAMRVMVAMSGGVDSSVAAALLAGDGHEVVGVTMRLWGGESDTGCCSVSDVDDARRVAQQLDIDHLVFNFTDDFHGAVVQPYVDAHADGVTPNPCIECNRRVKFARLAERADVLGFDAVATGHHARVARRDGRWTLQRGADRMKDQSYVVHMLGQAELARTLFPVGRFADKAQVRALAGRLGLRTAAKPDSQDVCFITSTGGRQRVPAPPAAAAPGTRGRHGRRSGRRGRRRRAGDDRPAQGVGVARRWPEALRRRRGPRRGDRRRRRPRTTCCGR